MNLRPSPFAFLPILALALVACASPIIVVEEPWLISRHAGAHGHRERRSPRIAPTGSASFVWCAGPEKP